MKGRAVRVVIRWLALSGAAPAGLFGLLLCIASAATAEDADPATHKAIQERVTQTQQAGYERHDLPRYLSLFSDDVRVTVGRTATPDKLDVTIDRQQLVATRSFYFGGVASENHRMEFSDIKVKIAGQQATLTALVKYREENYQMTNRERFHLRHDGGEWKVYELRAWPYAINVSGFHQRYNDAYWKRSDREAFAALRGGNARAIVEACGQAQRFRAGLLFSTWKIEQDDATASDWVYHGWNNFHLGNVVTCKAAFRRALRMNPDVDLPHQIRSALAAEKQSSGAPAPNP